MSFTVYKSSAGSGKTYTLVKEYLKIVLMHPTKFRNILAITFTNKAANEMKERIISNLIELSATEPDKNSITIKYLLPELISDLKIDTETITKRSSEALELILHNYSDFAIGTIDSFVHKIIRIFAHDLHLPLNFDVEMDEDTLISQAIDLLISRVGTDEKLTKVLMRFTEDKTENEQNWNIETDLQTFAKSLLKEDGQYQIEKLKKLTLDDFLKINKKILENIKKFEDSVKEKAGIAIQLIHKNNVSISSFYYGNQGIGKYFDNLFNGDFEKIKPNSRVIQTIEKNKWYSGKTDDYQKYAIDNIKSELKEIYFDIEENIINGYSKYMVLKLLRRNIYPLAVLNEIEKILNEIKTQNNIVHISEFNKRIADIVLNEPVPFIYERLGEKYKYFLIDEFQDTSVLQWHNLLPLIDNS
ncbi:MAG: UvrD-helicase domain-containing protein, partial [Bacteroidales bacterium]|nr:UvrD-helicase domain-containing protein [Bacteroidales bacterium]